MNRSHLFLSSFVRIRAGLLLASQVPRNILFHSLSNPRPLIIPSFCNVPLRWKSKGKGKPKSAPLSKDQLPEELLALIKEDEMNKQFSASLTRFQSALQQRLSLKITPQMLADLPITEAHTKLGQIANLVSQQQQQSGAKLTGADQLLLVDLAARPELVGIARKAVSHFLDSTGVGSSSIQSAGPSAFTVRLRTVVTREAREDLIHKGHEMLNQIKREMDRIYQMHDKLIPGTPEGKKHFSEDHLFTAREYLRATVKQYHAHATALWEKKHAELQSN